MSNIVNSSAGISFLGVNVLSIDQKERWHRTQAEATWVIVCNWADRITLRQQLMGGVYLIGGVISFLSPFTHPNYDAMFVQNVNVDGHDGDTGRTVDPLDGSGVLPGYKYATLEVEFAYFDLDIGDEKIDYSFKMIAVPNHTFKWALSGDLLLGIESPGLLDININFQRTKNYQATLPVATIIDILGCVNLEEWLGADPEQALYLGATSTRQFTTQGTHMWSITHSAAITQQGWNTFINPDTGTFDRIIFAGSDQPVYPLTSFEPLGLTS